MTSQDNEPVWVALSVVDALHEAQLTEHGGLPGTRDQGALESALARPQNSWAYEQNDLCSLAAAYAFGIARNHPFSDGNKRTAFVVALVFLADNGVELMFERDDGVATFLALAAGELTEDALADWFRKRIAPAG